MPRTRSHTLPAPVRSSPPTALDIGKVENDHVVFENWRGAADLPQQDPPAFTPPDQRTGFAIMGLGRLALGEILPAFAETLHSKPTALISGHPDKARAVAKQYGIPDHAIYDYSSIRRIADNPEIDAVYIVTPNGLHPEHLAAVVATGKPVLCEKPMSNTLEDAILMDTLCREAGVKLMIAYRCQYEKYNRAVIDLTQGGQLGKPRLIEATNTQMQGPADQWRMKPGMAGGGSLPDIGLYCLNGARNVIGEDPEEVFAWTFSPTGDSRYTDIDETTAFMLRFPSGAIANCATSYGAHESKDMRVRLENGWISLENAFAYQGQRLFVARRDGDHESVSEWRIDAGNQFALEIDHFADCIRNNREPRTPGSEGIRDQILMTALYESARTGRPVRTDTALRARGLTPKTVS
ncbi:gfo/Idh/MocA family oxidoreductase [Acetobacter musti]|uniref:Gfo/Idh/MocA family oxidoreductase n=1 Tax=Acetobacter musti TaxID=864732 RepID=A0ABX0JNR1_9PROT|nr:Gfo/Idh/MocA family oxidoreductase [Acetobacter musti]NHN83274.1 gfo/Idh/MocA family oxidoreductase [Acetobacter musti]